MKIVEESVFNTVGISLLVGMVLLMIFVGGQYSVHTEYGIAYRKHPDPLRKIGTILCDHELDDPSFTVCDENRIYERVNTRVAYRSGITSIREQWNAFADKCAGAMSDDGVLTARFVVNCEGEVGRIRLFAVDRSYQEHVFSEELVQSIHQFVNSLQNWTPGMMDAVRYDSYAQLKFSVRQGLVTEISL